MVGLCELTRVLTYVRQNVLEGGGLSSMYTHKHPLGTGSHPGNIYLCW